MGDYTKPAALLIIIAGLLTCFWGYRILKLSLAIIGFIAGAFGGWQIGLSLAESNTAIAIACALVGGLIGMALCLWVYFLGVFLVGAAAGTVVAAAFFSGLGHPIQPVIFLALPIASGVIALLVQRFMIIVSTAFSGSYLITAGIWSFVADHQDASRIWLHPAHSGAPGSVGYGALLLWLLLALVGVGTQLRAKPKPVETETGKK